MPPSPRPWFRAYSEMPRDRKLRREKPETRWLWVVLMCMAGASTERGVLLVGSSLATLDDIADEAALPLAKVRVGMSALEAAGMIERRDDGAWRLRNWDARQYESDRSTDRVRALRERRRNVSSSVSVTPPESEAETEVPPGGDVASRPEPESSRSPVVELVAAYVDEYRLAHGAEDPIRSWRDQAGLQAKNMLASGVDRDDVQGCLVAAGREGKSPTVLPHLLADLQAERGRVRRTDPFFDELEEAL